jgi:hypothetical protein
MIKLRHTLNNGRRKYSIYIEFFFWNHTYQKAEGHYSSANIKAEAVGVYKYIYKSKGGIFIFNDEINSDVSHNAIRHLKNKKCSECHNKSKSSAFSKFF